MDVEVMLQRCITSSHPVVTVPTSPLAMDASLLSAALSSASITDDSDSSMSPVSSVSAAPPLSFGRKGDLKGKGKGEEQKKKKGKRKAGAALGDDDDDNNHNNNNNNNNNHNSDDDEEENKPKRKQSKLSPLSHDQRIDRRKQQNRDAAQKSREKKKAYVSGLEVRSRELEEENRRAQEENKRLKNENKLLRQQLAQAMNNNNNNINNPVYSPQQIITSPQTQNQQRQVVSGGDNHMYPIKSAENNTYDESAVGGIVPSWNDDSMYLSPPDISIDVDVNALLAFQQQQYPGFGSGQQQQPQQPQPLWYELFSPPSSSSSPSPFSHSSSSSTTNKNEIGCKQSATASSTAQTAASIDYGRVSQLICDIPPYYGAPTSSSVSSSFSSVSPFLSSSSSSSSSINTKPCDYGGINSSVFNDVSQLVTDTATCLRDHSTAAASSSLTSIAGFLVD